MLAGGGGEHRSSDSFCLGKLAERAVPAAPAQREKVPSKERERREGLLLSGEQMCIDRHGDPGQLLGRTNGLRVFSAGDLWAVSGRRMLGRTG